MKKVILFLAVLSLVASLQTPHVQDNQLFGLVTPKFAAYGHKQTTRYKRIRRSLEKNGDTEEEPNFGFGVHENGHKTHTQENTETPAFRHHKMTRPTHVNEDTNPTNNYWAWMIGNTKKPRSETSEEGYNQSLMSDNLMSLSK